MQVRFQIAYSVLRISYYSERQVGMRGDVGYDYGTVGAMMGALGFVFCYPM